MRRVGLPMPESILNFFLQFTGGQMQKSKLLAAIQDEIHKHDFSHFIDEPPSIAQGGKGVVVSGCPACKKRLNTTGQFLEHLANDAMPQLIEKLSERKAE